MGTYSAFPITNAKGSTSPFLSSVPGATASSSLADRFGDIINVKRDFNAVGNGSADDTTAIQNALNAAFITSGTAHGISAELNRPVFFPAGHYKITSPLTLRSVRGAHIFGAGRFTTKINNASGGSVFVTNGCEFSTFEHMLLQATAGSGACCVDLDWDNTGPCALQSNTFRDMFFGESDIGLKIAGTGYMGSETLIEQCFFSVCTTGIYTASGNACDNVVIGGDIQGCAIGIHVGEGDVATIIGVSFQNGTNTWDIQIDSSTGQGYIITGCRSESANFLQAGGGLGVAVIGCTQSIGTSGTFARFIGSLRMDMSSSQNGQLKTFGSATLYGSGNHFGRSDWDATDANIGNALTTGFILERLATSAGALTSATFASLPAAGVRMEGALVPVIDSTTATPGATITGGGTNHVLAYCNGTNWIVVR